jgi:hypothetical protein
MVGTIPFFDMVLRGIQVKRRLNSIVIGALTL